MTPAHDNPRYDKQGATRERDRLVEQIYQVRRDKRSHEFALERLRNIERDLVLKVGELDDLLRELEAPNEHAR